MNECLKHLLIQNEKLLEGNYRFQKRPHKQPNSKGSVSQRTTRYFKETNVCQTVITDVRRFLCFISSSLNCLTISDEYSFILIFLEILGHVKLDYILWYNLKNYKSNQEGGKHTYIL